MTKIACKLDAISPGARPLYQDLMLRIRTAIHERSELPDGYAFHLDGSVITLVDVAHWMSLERLCCPFFAFQLSASGEHDRWTLQLTGPEGVKPLIAEAFRPV